MEVLITGVTGMAGSHLADYILREHPGVEVHGLCRWRSPLDNVRRALIDGLVLHYGDLTDLHSLAEVARAREWGVVFHLAAQSYVPYSFEAPVATMQTNIVGTENLFQILRSCGYGFSAPRIVLVTSSEVYGQVREDELPIMEEQPFRPASPYGVSKVAQDMIGYEWGLRGANVVRLRPFTFTGPRRGSVFAASAFARQIALAEVGRQEAVVRHGNLSSVRTWCDVRDMVRAFWAAGTSACRAGEVYNVGGETTATVGWVLEYLCSLAHLAMQPEPFQDLMRPTDVTLQVPDCSKFHRETGWAPAIPLVQTLEDLLDYHRTKAAYGA
jgi:GDP-mannose 4,6-dehydratase